VREVDLAIIVAFEIAKKRAAWGRQPASRLSELSLVDAFSAPRYTKRFT